MKTYKKAKMGWIVAGNSQSAHTLSNTRDNNSMKCFMGCKFSIFNSIKYILVNKGDKFFTLKKNHHYIFDTWGKYSDIDKGDFLVIIY